METIFDRDWVIQKLIDEQIMQSKKCVLCLFISSNIILSSVQCFSKTKWYMRSFLMAAIVFLALLYSLLRKVYIRLDEY